MTKKYIIPIITGENNFPKISPNLIHNILKGVNIFEFIKPKNKKNNAIKNNT